MRSYGCKLSFFFGGPYRFTCFGALSQHNCRPYLTKVVYAYVHRISYIHVYHIYVSYYIYIILYIHHIYIYKTYYIDIYITYIYIYIILQIHHIYINIYIYKYICKYIYIYIMKYIYIILYDINIIYTIYIYIYPQLCWLNPHDFPRSHRHPLLN